MRIALFKSPRQALLWELWRTSQINLLLRIGLACAFVLLLFSLMRLTGNGPESVVIGGITVLTLTFSGVAAQSWIVQLDRSQSGFSFSCNFVRPVSTMTLVSLPVAFTVASSTVCYLLPAVLFRFLTDVNLPLVGPVTLICCVVVCFIAASWSPASIAGRAAAVVSVATAIVILAVLAHQGRQEPWIIAIGRPEAFDFRWYHFAAMLLTAAVAFAITVISVERQRHGDNWLRPLRSDRCATDQSIALASRSSLERWRPFTSPSAAQFWYEFRRFGRRTFWISLLAPVAVMVLIATGMVLGYDPQGADRTWMLALLICPVVYQIIGIDGAVGLRPVRGVLVFPVFDATRAMSSDHLIETKLIVVAVGSLAGWLLMALAASSHTLLLGDLNFWLQTARTAAEIFDGVPRWASVLALSGFALVLTSTTSVLLAVWLWVPFHPKICGCLSVTAFAHVLLVVWDSGRSWAFLPLWQIYGYLIPALITGVCLWILGQAYTVGILRTRLFGVGVAAWVTYIGTASFALLTVSLPHSVPIPGQALAAGVAMLFAPLAAVAAAPLALNQHRHG